MMCTTVRNVRNAWPYCGPRNARAALLQHISSTAQEGLRDMVPGVLMASTIPRPSGSMDPRTSQIHDLWMRSWSHDLHIAVLDGS